MLAEGRGQTNTLLTTKTRPIISAGSILVLRQNWLCGGKLGGQVLTFVLCDWLSTLCPHNLSVSEQNQYLLHGHLTTYLPLENPHTFLPDTQSSIKSSLNPTINTKITLKAHLSQGKTSLIQTTNRGAISRHSGRIWNLTLSSDFKAYLTVHVNLKKKVRLFFM